MGVFLSPPSLDGSVTASPERHTGRRERGASSEDAKLFFGFPPVSKDSRLRC